MTAASEGTSKQGRKARSAAGRLLASFRPSTCDNDALGHRLLHPSLCAVLLLLPLHTLVTACLAMLPLNILELPPSSSRLSHYMHIAG